MNLNGLSRSYESSLRGTELKISERRAQPQKGKNHVQGDPILRRRASHLRNSADRLSYKSRVALLLYRS